MSLPRILLLICLLPLNFILIAEPNKQALKYIREKAYDKAEEQVLKSLEKDSINPAGHYLAGLLLIQPLYQKKDIDSAYYHTLVAQEQWIVIEERDQQKLFKMGISPDSVDLLRKTIEIQAYGEALNQMSLVAFEAFFNGFKNDSLNFLLTIARDSLAFSYTEAKNTWQDYEEFINSYPESLQIEIAQKRYHELIFEEKANSKSVREIEAFLRDVIDTPFRDELEKQLLLQYTVSNTFSAYLKFIRKYPSSKSKKLAINALYHFSKSAQDFEFPASLINDSIRREMSLEGLDLIPFFKDEKYGFFSASTGDKVIDAELESIDKRYLCEISDDVLLKVSSDGEQYLMNRSGKLIRVGLENFRILARGIVSIEKDGKTGCMLVSGEEILSLDYDEIELVGDQYLKARRGNKFGLFSFLGKRILINDYEDISYLGGDIITLLKNDKIALVNTASFLKEDFDEDRLSFSFEEVEAFENKYILCFSNKAESLLNFELEELIPLGIHEIYMEGKYVYTKSKWGYKLFDLQKNQLKEDLYQKIQTGINKLAIKKNNKWNLFPDNIEAQPVLDVDSVYFLTEKATIVTKSGSRMVLFENGTNIPIAAGESVESLIRAPQNTKTDFLVIKKPRGQIEVVTPNGRSLFELKAENIEQVTDSLYLLKTNDGMSLINEEGKDVLKKNYDLIEAEVQKGIVTFHLLNGGKLGIYNFKSKALIKPGFIQKIDLLSNSVYIARKESGAGIINVKDQKKQVFEYKEIEALNDTLVLINDGRYWRLININTDEVLLNDIIQLDKKVYYESFHQIKFRQARGFGLLDSRVGIFLPGIYNEILSLGGKDKPYFFAERYLADSEFYIVLYINKSGDKIKSIAYRESEYSNILCEN